MSKYINAKGTKNYQDYDLLVKKCEDYDRLAKKCEDYDFIVKSWQDAAQANALLSKRIQMLEAELEKPQRLEAAVQEQARQTAIWKEAYESVVNSRTWRLANKLKRLTGRKIQQ